MNYRTIAKNGSTEETIKKSRFICQAKRITNEAEGRDFITQIKKEHYKARHSCSAMIIGENSDIKRSSDDGEPSGTAGIPMLSVLEKKQLTNLVLVVTRYFGGIKLGTGGLIRAYSGGAANTLKALGIVEVKKQTGLRLELTYPQYQTFANFLKEHQLQEYNTDFSVTVNTTIMWIRKILSSPLTSLLSFIKENLKAMLLVIKLLKFP